MISGKCITLEDPPEIPVMYCFTQDGKFIIRKSGNNIVKLWNMDTD